MSAYTCAQVRELAPELALGSLPGAERAEVLLHLGHCVRCQALVRELTDVADVLTLLAPEVEPPAGFEDRVLAAIRPPRRRAARRWLASVAVAAAAASILSIAMVRVVDATNDSLAVAAPVGVEMVGGANGYPAGWLYVAQGRSVAIAVDYGLPAGRYDVQVRFANGDRASLGAIAVTASGRGSWTGSSVRPITSGSVVTLVDGQGVELCNGALV